MKRTRSTDDDSLPHKKISIGDSALFLEEMSNDVFSELASFLSHSDLLRLRLNRGLRNRIEDVITKRVAELMPMDDIKFRGTC